MISLYLSEVRFSEQNDTSQLHHKFVAYILIIRFEWQLLYLHIFIILHSYYRICVKIYSVIEKLD